MSNGETGPASKGSLFLEFYKTTLEHRSKLISIIMVSGIAVAIPAAVDAYKARIETDLKTKEQELKKLEFQQKSIQDFSKFGLQQDIELRIRLAEYFAALSDKDYENKWDAYRRSLTDRREVAKRLLDEINDQIDSEEIKSQPNVLTVRKLYRAKRWLEAEFNPVEPSEKVTLRSGGAQFPTNEGLDPINIDNLISLLGPPLKDMNSLSDSCQQIDNELLRSQVKTETLLGLKVTLLEPALDSFKQVLDNIAKRDRELAGVIGSLGGLCVRKLRGSDKSLSRHAFGLGIDITVRGKFALSPDVKDDFRVVAEEFRKAGWVWGGAWSLLKDYRHFEVSQQLLQQWIDSGKISVTKQ